MKKLLFIIVSFLFSIYLGFLFKTPEPELLGYASHLKSQWKAKLFMESKKGDFFSLAGEPFGYEFNYLLAIFSFIILYLFSRTVYYDTTFKFVKSIIKNNSTDVISNSNPIDYFNKIKSSKWNYYSKFKSFLKKIKNQEKLKIKRRKLKTPIISLIVIVSLMLISILFLIKIFLFDNNWQKYEIPNAIEISVPNDLEIRGGDSVYNELMDGLRDEYNPNHVVKIGKSELIFQPKGTDNQEISATEDVTRILVKHFKIDSNSFPKWNFKMTKADLVELDEFFKTEGIKELKTLPFSMDIIEVFPSATGNINRMTYVNSSYIGEIEGDLSYMETYQFFNINEKVIISLTTGLEDKDKWIDIFKDVVKTFEFKQKNN